MGGRGGGITTNPLRAENSHSNCVFIIIFRSHTPSQGGGGGA